MTVAIAGGLAAFWLLMIWRARVERGRVHRTPLGAFIVRFIRVQIEVGDQLTPAFRACAKAAATLAAAIEESKEGQK